MAEQLAVCLRTCRTGGVIYTANGKRVWFLVTLCDGKKFLILYITEKAALQPSGFADAANFAAAHEAGKLWFPQIYFPGTLLGWNCQTIIV